ncbi:MAG: hypothetical protein ACWGQW_12370 [bacterium]
MTPDQVEKWWEHVHNIPFTEGLETEEKEVLEGILQNPVLIKAFGLQLHAVTALGSGMLNLDLKTEEGISNAVRMQGQASGIVRGIESLVGLCLDGEKEEEDNGQG